MKIDERWVKAIGVYKFVQTVLLIAVGVEAMRLMHVDLLGVMTEWVRRTGLNPGGRYVGRFLLKAASLTPVKIKEIGVGAFVYAGLFLTEGIGLWYMKRWAEWMTIVITASAIPLEIWELYRHTTPVRIAVMVINLVVVAFLVGVVVRKRNGKT